MHEPNNQRVKTPYDPATAAEMHTSHWRFLKRPPWRTVVPGVLLLLLGLAGYALWQPGTRVTDGRHDRGTNGIWLGHGWLGDDGWFQRNNRDPQLFRTPERIQALATRLRTNHITFLYPHLCPCSPDGPLPPVDAAQTERFLDGMDGTQVMPWIGGILDETCFPDKPAWRRPFAESAAALLQAHPRLAGVQVNIEPLPSGHQGYLQLLHELRAALPAGKRLGVAAYPPPTRWHPYPDVHWDAAYYRAVAANCDQLAVMLYDTAIRRPKLYEALVSGWTREALEWSGTTPVLLGLPAYADAASGYHDPQVENLQHALRGIHAGLGASNELPANYTGAAIYSAWEMDAGEWALWQTDFCSSTPKP